METYYITDSDTDSISTIGSRKGMKESDKMLTLPLILSLCYQNIYAMVTILAHPDLTQ